MTSSKLWDLLELATFGTEPDMRMLARLFFSRDTAIMWHMLLAMISPKTKQLGVDIFHGFCGLLKPLELFFFFAVFGTFRINEDFGKVTFLGCSFELLLFLACSRTSETPE